MYASIRRSRSDRGSEVVRRVGGEFVALLRRAPGFVSYHLVDAGNGTFVSVSLFETREGAEESNRIAAAWVAQNVAPLVQGRPDVIGEKW